METPYENVYAVEDWYDGPRSGFADYQQKPHFYRSLHLDGNNYSHYNYDEDRFELTSVSAQVLEWAVESDKLWQSWNEAYRTGTLPEGTDSDERILPEDRARYQELGALIEQHIKTQSETPFIVRGTFELGCRRVQWQENEA